MRGDAFGSEYKPLDKDILAKLFKFLSPYKKWVWLAFLFTILSSSLAPLRPYLIKVTIDDYVSAMDKTGLAFMLMAILLLVVVNGAIQFLMTYLMQWVGQKVLYDIRNRLFEHLNNLSVSFFDKNPVGRLVTRLTNDVEGLNQMFSQGVVMIFADILLILWIIAFMFYTNVQLSFLTLSILPALLFVTTVFRRKVRVLFRDLRIELSAMNSFISENLAGIGTIKIFSQEKSRLDVFDKINLKTRELNVKTIFYYAIFFPTVEMLSSIAIGIVIWYSAGNILSGLMTVGTLIAFLQYSEMFFRPVRDLSEKYTTLQSAMVAAERIAELLETEVAPQPNDETANDFNFNDKIEFRNVSFSYSGDSQVLNNVSFTIHKGETVAIVGATGSGKTTIINLLCKFYDYTNGDILIDGKSLNAIAAAALRSKIALVMQDVFLFSRSIKSNINLGSDGIAMEDVQKAADAIGASSFIEKTESGYDTLLTERGANLSAGQRQLLAFSRAFAANPEILILDEATSNIDTDSEIYINNSLEVLLKDRTSIIIAHRLSTIQKADKIIVLHKGCIREIGSHSELIAQQGLYHKLYQLQTTK